MKIFLRDANYPAFYFNRHNLQGQSLFGQLKPKLSLFGHKKPDKTETDDEKILENLNASEREENKQAVSNVMTEKAHIES